MKVFYVTHSIKNYEIGYDDAQAIADRVNRSVEAMGVSGNERGVQAELDEIASESIQITYRLTISSDDVDVGE